MLRITRRIHYAPEIYVGLCMYQKFHMYRTDAWNSFRLYTNIFIFHTCVLRSLCSVCLVGDLNDFSSIIQL